MQDQKENHVFQELVWGHGVKVLDVFLEPTCPHSGRAFGKLKPLIERVGEEQVTVRIFLHSQPWHIFSSVVSRAVLAASVAKGSNNAAYLVMEKVFENREDFICEAHCKGPNMEISPAEILRRIYGLTGLDLGYVFESKAVTDLFKRHTRFSRQNGVHGSPTFMVDGLINDNMSSSDDIPNWIKCLSLTESDAAGRK